MSALFKKDQLYQQLRNDILGGKYPDGFMLPPAVDFARQLGVGKVTLCSALENLEQEMLVKRVRGKGTFINYHPEKSVGRNVLMVASIGYLQMPQNTWTKMFPEFHRKAEELGYGEIFMMVEELEQLAPDEFRQMLKKGNITGIFVFPHVFEGGEPWLELLKQSGLPVILTNALGSDYEVTGCAAVTIKMADGGKDAIRFLAKSGCRKIGILARKAAFGNRFMEMTPKEIYTEIRGCGMDFPKDGIAYCHYDRKQIHDTVAGWLKDPEPVDAIMTSNSSEIPFIYEAIRGCGLRPNEVKVVVFAAKNNFLIEPLPIIFDRDDAGVAAKSYQILQEADKWYPEAPPNRYHYMTLTDPT